VDNHRIHVFNLPAGGQRIPRYGSLESAQPRDGLERAVEVHSVQTAGPFHCVETAFALDGIEGYVQ
jgi:hypothetical protein